VAPASRRRGHVCRGHVWPGQAGRLQSPVVAGYRVIRESELEYETRPHEPGEAPRHGASVTDDAALRHTRASFFRYEPGAKGRRHDDKVQEETYVPINGSMTMYLGEPAIREEVGPGGLIHVESGIARQVVNEGSADLLVFIYGSPPERGDVEFLDSAV
jgi:quercetin dioxygenase-like cupin family protein